MIAVFGWISFACRQYRRTLSYSAHNAACSGPPRVLFLYGVATMDGHAVDPAITASLPQHPFLLTAQVDDLRTGLVTAWAQQCSDSPMLVTVAVPRGTEIEPLIRDGRTFALTALDPNDRLIPRRFNPPPPHDEDPFVGMRLMTSVTGSPILRRGRFWLDCELVGHLAPDCSHRIYIGQVVASGLCSPAALADYRVPANMIASN